MKGVQLTKMAQELELTNFCNFLAHKTFLLKIDCLCCGFVDRCNTVLPRIIKLAAFDSITILSAFSPLVKGYF